MEQYCRLCLVYDIAMKKFCDTEEIQFITNIIKQHGYNNIVTKTHYVCYICQALLTKIYNFVTQALRAQRILHEFLKKKDLVTVNNMLHNIDRFKLNLNYNNLSIHQLNIGSIDEYEAIASIKGEENTAHHSNTLSIDNRLTFENDSQYGDVTLDSDDDMTHGADCYLLFDHLNNAEETVNNEIVLQSVPYTVDVETYDILDMFTSDTDLSQKGSQCFEVSFQSADCDKKPEETDCIKILNHNSLQSKKSLKTNRKKKEDGAIEDNQDMVKLELDHNYGISDINSLQHKKSLRTNRKKKEDGATEDDKDSAILGTAILQNNPKKPKRKYKKRKTTQSTKQNYTCPALDTGSVKSDKVQKKKKSRKRKAEKQTDFNNCAESDECAREYPTKCDDCDSLISTKREHMHHYLSDHKNIKYPYSKTGLIPYFVCETCGTKINGEYHFKAHLLTHGEKTVQCQQCSKMFHTRIRMLVHIQRVHAPKKYVCDYCGKRFPDKSTIKMHMRTHTGERPFRCHICGAGFAQRGNWQIHVRHHESRPYPVKDNEENKSKCLEQRRKKNKRRTYKTILKHSSRQ